MADNRKFVTSADDGVISLTPAKPSFWARVKAHYRRFWWAHVIGTIIVVLIVTLPVVYVGYPNIAQSDLNASKIVVEKVDISNTTPNSFRLNQTQILKTDSIFHPVFYSFKANASLAGSSTPFTTVTIPQITAHNGTVVNLSQDVDLTGHASAFGDFSKAILVNKEIDMILYGRPYLKQGSLPTITVTYSKTVKIAGLDQLKGFSLTEYSLLTHKQPDGANMVGTVFIPNPSVLTIPMGNITLDLFVDGEPVGQSFVDNLTLRRGNNSFPMRSRADQLKILKIASRKYSSDWIVPFDIRGNKSVYDGEELPYFSRALQATKLRTILNVKSLLSA